MPLRLWRRIKIAPGVTVNLSKTGVSTSFGPRGAKVTLGRGKVRKTVGLPGTGLFYTTTSKTGASEPPPAAPATDASWRTTPTEPPKSGRRRKWLILGGGTIVALAAIGSLSGGASPVASTAPSPAGATPLAFVSGASKSPTSTASTTEPTATAASPKATARPKPTPTPKPTSKPVTLSVRVTKHSSSVGRGSMASVTIKTHKGARCSIDVEYASGPSDAAGLGDKTAPTSGVITWNWEVGPSTTKGRWSIYVGCDWKDQTADASTSFRVK